ncbi:MAG: aminoglycoside/choline kinase family phosphotransferase [Myxococcota bacterium]|jgi:aminoglycoside/choline kinase family phosphotransferase
MSSLLQLSDNGQRDALAALVKREFGATLESTTPISPGLGNRRFFRLRLANSTGEAPASVIVRAEAEESTDKRAQGVAPEPALEPLRTFLDTAGVPVPKVYAEDSDLCVLLLEDVGDNSLEHAVAGASTDDRIALYQEACALIPMLQRLEAPEPVIPAFERFLDRALLQSKAERVIGWALPWWLGRPPNSGEQEVVKAVYDRIADVCEDAPARLSHRDLKAANIHIREGGAVGERLVLIDIQGAFMAPPEYDLVCLLRDSHVRLPAQEVALHIASTRVALPDAPKEAEFAERFALLTLARVAKDAAHYIHASIHGEDARYLPFVPTARKVLKEAVARCSDTDPVLQRFADLIYDFKEPRGLHDSEPQ